MVHLPTVQLIGAQKAGTSAIADWLFQDGGFCRPKVFDGEPWYYGKEVHFFDLYERYRRGVGFYAQRFPQDGSLTLDATPDSLPFPNRVFSTYKAAGNDSVNTLKIIVVLRDPLMRELSLYNHLAFDCRNLDASERNEWHDQVLQNGREIMSFDQFVVERSIPALHQDSGPGQSTRHSLYGKHLSAWFELFDRRQILVLSYEELNRDPRKIQERIQQFLGFPIPGEIKHANSNDSPMKVRTPTGRAKNALLSAFSEANEMLYRLLDSKQGPPMEERPFPRFSEE